MHTLEGTLRFLQLKRYKVNVLKLYLRILWAPFALAFANDFFPERQLYAHVCILHIPIHTEHAACIAAGPWYVIHGQRLQVLCQFGCPF